LRTNVGVKLLSLALALVLWSFVRGSKPIEREQQIPVEYVNLPDSLLFLEPPPRLMRVLVSAPAQEMLLRLQFMRDVAARIDLAEASATTDRVIPSPADIGDLKNEHASVVRILSPTVIPLRLARRGERQLPVRLVLRGGDKRGYCLADSPLVVPASVVCTGPEAMLRALEAIQTQPLELAARRGQSTAALDLDLVPKGLACVPERVTVTYTSERLRRRTLAAARLTLVPPARAGLDVAMDTLSAALTVAGPEPRIETLDADDVGLFVDASRLEPGRYERVPLIAQLPPWVELVSLEPDAVDLTVRSGGRARADSTRRGAGSRLP
jgi:hypothetical protein